MNPKHYRPETWRTVLADRVRDKLAAMQARIGRHLAEANRDGRTGDSARLAAHVGELCEMQQDLSDLLLRDGADASGLVAHVGEYANGHYDDYRDAPLTSVDRLRALGRLNACREVRQWLLVITRAKTLKAAMKARTT